MIEFNGDISGNSRQFLFRLQSKYMVMATSITSVIFLIPIILAAVYWDALALLFIIPLAMMVGFSFIHYDNCVPNRIFIDTEEETIVHFSKQGERFHMLSSVKCVKDYGEWYHFEFNYFDRDMYFVCQKSLLTQGSIEEFENLFADKLIRISD